MKPNELMTRKVDALGMSLHCLRTDIMQADYLGDAESNITGTQIKCYALEKIDQALQELRDLRETTPYISNNVARAESKAA